MLAYANPVMATEPRARLGAKLAEITPGDIDVFFFTNGGAEANENAFKIARCVHRPPEDPGALPLVPRRHRRRDRRHRRSAALGASRRCPGIVHVLDPYHGIERGWDIGRAVAARTSRRSSSSKGRRRSRRSSSSR